MKITKHVGEHKLPFMLYTGGSNNLVMCLHGIGEKGPSNGSELHEVEVHGFPKHARAGYEYQFDVCAPQLYSLRWEDVVDLCNTLAVKYSYQKVFITGLSSGGELTWKCLQGDFKNIKLVGIAPVSSKWYEGTELACSLPDIPIDVWHNKDDGKMPHNRGPKSEKVLMDLINACPGRKNKLSFEHIFAGDSHDAWTNAYRTGSPLEAFIFNCFGGVSEVITTPNESVTKIEYSPDAGQIIFETITGRKLTIKPNG